MKNLILILLLLSACVEHEIKPSNAKIAAICQTPRYWTLSSNYITFPLPYGHQRGLVYTASPDPTKAVPGGNIVTRATNTGTTTIEICTDLNCFGKFTLYPGQSNTFSRSITATYCEPAPTSHVQYKEIKVRVIACNQPISGVYTFMYTLQLISATNGHTVNMTNQIQTNSIYMVGTCNF